MGALLRFLIITVGSFLLLRGLSRAVSGAGGGTVRPRASAPGAGREPRAASTEPALLVRDPVCGVCVPQERAVAGSAGTPAQSLYFCSTECLQQFDPARHRAHSATV